MTSNINKEINEAKNNIFMNEILESEEIIEKYLSQNINKGILDNFKINSYYEYLYKNVANAIKYKTRYHVFVLITKTVEKFQRKNFQLFANKIKSILNYSIIWNKKNIKKIYESNDFVTINEKIKRINCDDDIKSKIYIDIGKRYFKKNDTVMALKFAYLAWNKNPDVYHLKWLIFRLYDNGDIIKAEAFLQYLPLHVKLSTSESKKIEKVKQKSYYSYYNRAKDIIEKELNLIELKGRDFYNNEVNNQKLLQAKISHNKQEKLIKILEAEIERLNQNNLLLQQKIENSMKILKQEDFI